MPTQLHEVIVDTKYNTDLPSDIVAEILKFCDKKTFFTCSLVCKKWFDTTAMNMFWLIPLKQLKVRIANNNNRKLRNIYIETRKLNHKIYRQQKRELILSRTSQGCIITATVICVILTILFVLLAFSWVIWVPLILFLLKS